MIREWLRIGLLFNSLLFSVYIVFGLIMDRIETWCQHLIGHTLGRIGIVVTGLIGTVVHEFSHFIMCLIFGHKVVEVAWFRPVQGLQDGILGYVQHSYNPSSWYQQAGNFFIGIAPLLVGPMILLILFRILLPQSSKAYSVEVNRHIQAVGRQFSIIELLKLISRQIISLWRHLFKKSHFKKIGFWVLLFSIYSISTHMSLSMADLRGAAIGLGILVIGVMGIAFVVALFQMPFKKLMPWLIRYNCWVLTLFSIALSFSLLTLLLFKIIYFIT